MSVCTICLRDGHTASSCKGRPANGSFAHSFAAGMRALREAPDEAQPNSDSRAWERLQEAMRRGS